MNTAQSKSRKQRLSLPSTDLHATGRTKQIMLVHIKLLDARYLIQSPKYLINNIADRQIRRIDKVQHAIFLAVVDATHVKPAENFQLIFWSNDTEAGASASEVITPVGFYWAESGHLVFSFTGWIYIGAFSAMVVRV